LASDPSDPSSFGLPVRTESAQPVVEPPVSPPPIYAWIPTPRRKFQHRYRTHILLFLATALTATAFQGPLYAFALLTILGAHEFGHYVQCRRYDVDATLPYFLPAPIMTGTFGAVIRIREPFPSKRALFDIGVTGPIAGFIALIPFLWVGIHWSTVVSESSVSGIELGDPLLVKAFVWLTFGSLPAGKTVLVHPFAFAAWWGLLATALNLLPFGQFDGGHVSYSLLGRRSWIVSALMVAVAATLTFVAFSWISVTIIMLAMSWFFGIRHPRVVDEDVPLDSSRQLVALLALVIFILSFTPVPIRF
jgi:membrane-associated protease RseP (regulator of RpoE activity)